MLIAGVDLSLRETGLAVVHEDGEPSILKIIKSNPKFSIEQRITMINNTVYEWIKSPHLKIVYIEGLALAARGQRLAQIAGLHYHLRVKLYNCGIPFKTKTPTQLKKFVIKGSAKKEQMLLHCYKRWGIEFDNNNLCDAYCLARMALENVTNPKRKARKSDSKGAGSKGSGVNSVEG